MSRGPLPALISLLVFCACAAGPAARPEFKDIPSVSRSFAQQLVAWRKADGLSIRVYNTGAVIAPGAEISSIKSAAARARLDIPAFLIKHPVKGYVLFDTGLPADVEKMSGSEMRRLKAFFPPYLMGRDQNIVSQLQADGVSASQVGYVVLSSLRLEHAGMAGNFPEALVYVDRREWEAQKEAANRKASPYQFDPLAMESRLRLRQVDLSSAPGYASFDHALDLFGDGTLFLVDLAGQTAGTMGLWINLDSGPVLLAAGASWVLDNHQDLAPPLPAHITDWTRYWRRLYQMQEVQRTVERLVIFPGHDLMPLRLQPRPDVVAIPFPR